MSRHWLVLTDTLQIQQLSRFSIDFNVIFNDWIVYFYDYLLKIEYFYFL